MVRSGSRTKAGICGVIPTALCASAAVETAHVVHVLMWHDWVQVAIDTVALLVSTVQYIMRSLRFSAEGPKASILYGRTQRLLGKAPDI